MWKFTFSLLTILGLGFLGLVINNKSPKTPEITPTNSPAATQVFEQTKIITQDLDVPWALAFLPDNSILVTERKGALRLIDKDGKLLTSPIAKISVKQNGESGLHGIAIDPKYSDNHTIFLYYTYSADGNNTFNRVSKYTFENQTLGAETIVVDKIPGAIFHDGGRIKFGPDGNLYITTGDAGEPSKSQDKNSLAGKILRVRDPSNPQVEIYSYGHRNPQGIAWDDKGNLWETEHGRSGVLSGLDELNKIEQGKNYGWPVIEGNKKMDGMVTPMVNSGASDTWAPAGDAIFEGSIYFGGLRGQSLYQVNLSTLELKTHFKNQFGRIRDVVLGPDNMLYITTSNKDGRGNPNPDDDKIIRVNPKLLK